MQRVAKLYESSIGKKVVMAVTGGLLVLFVIVHMLGNLKIYWGPGHDGHAAKIDVYGEFLRTFAHEALGHEGFLWIARVVLLLAVIAHLISAYLLTRTSWRARPVGYKKRTPVASTYASRTMRWGGVILGAFIVFHILHFTTGTAGLPYEHGQVYRNMVLGFQQPIVSLVYIVAMVFLGLHLYHGVWSGLQTLGVSNPRYQQWRRGLAAVIAVAVAGGNISIPVAVLAGIVHL